MSDILTFDGVSKRFGGLRAVHKCSVNVPEGILMGLIGPNGAGKSTLFNLASGLLPPDEGSIRVRGEELVGKRPEEVARTGIGRTFQTPRTFLSLSLMENMLASADTPGEKLTTALMGTYRQREAQLVDQARDLLELVGLSARANDTSEDLSGGELRMLEVARQLIRRPRVLLLDEPTAGVAPRLQQRLSELLVSLNDDGLTILVVEHNLRFLMNLVERVAVMVHGSVLTIGTPDEIRSDPRVISAYLGRSHGAA